MIEQFKMMCMDEMKVFVLATVLQREVLHDAEHGNEIYFHRARGSRPRVDIANTNRAARRACDLLKGDRQWLSPGATPRFHLLVRVVMHLFSPQASQPHPTLVVVIKRERGAKLCSVPTPAIQGWIALNVKVGIMPPDLTGSEMRMAERGHAVRIIVLIRAARVTSLAGLG